MFGVFSHFTISTSCEKCCFAYVMEKVLPNTSSQNC